MTSLGKTNFGDILSFHEFVLMQCRYADAVFPCAEGAQIMDWVTPPAGAYWLAMWGGSTNESWMYRWLFMSECVQVKRLGV